MEEESTTREADDVLEYFLRSVERDNKSINLTIQVPGAIITGELISVRRYTEELGKAVGRPVRVSEQSDGGERPAFDDIPVPEFLHLGNAHYVFGDGLVPNASAVTWRGRVADVTGYSIGTLSVQRS